MSSIRRLTGFTLVELLVVISIIGVLVAMLLPALGKSRAVAQMAMCQGNLKQTGVSMVTYSVDTSSALIARPDMGRGNSTWRNELTAIVNDRAPGIPLSNQDGYGADMNLGIFNAGSWMINDYGSVDTLYCPALTFENTTYTLALNKKYTKSIGTYLRSGGMLGTKPAIPVGGYAVAYTSYYFNWQLLGDGEIGVLGSSSGLPATYISANQFPYTEMSRPRGKSNRLSSLNPDFPVLFDERLNYRSYHNCTGFNTLRIDGGVRFVKTRSIIEAGMSSAMNAGSIPRYTPFASIPMSEDGSLDLANYGIAYAYNPFISWYALQSGFPEALRIAMSR